MGNIIDSASQIMSRAERQVELAAQNVANIATPGYKRVLSFDRLLGAGVNEYYQESEPEVTSDFTAGKMLNTGRALDLALAGDGFFSVRSPDGIVYTRQGQFDRDGDGRLVTGQGLVLQVDGGDLRLKSDNVKVLPDGTVLDDQAPVGKLSIVTLDAQAARPLDGGAYAAPESAVTPLDTPSVQQGMLEGSNVSMASEMVSIMTALRRAETGQRLATVYDDLMARVLQSLGPNA